MKRRLYTILVIAACFFTGCGTGSAAEKSMDGYAAEADPDTPVISEETKKTSSGETEVMESIKSESTDDTDTAAGVYDGILDMFYYKILEGWDCTEDVSYMFYWDYTSVETLSDAGYAMADLDGNGVPELLVSTVEDAADGMIFDLYTYADGKVIHAATSGERYCYYLCEDNTIYYWATSGASNSTQINYSVDAGTGRLHPEKIVAFDQNEDKDSPWFYGTQDHYDRMDGLDFDNMSHITESEAQDICDSWKTKAIELTLFEEYSPQGGKPADMLLKQAFQSAAGSETELCFVCEDFDGDGTVEAFGITGTDDGIDLNDARIYYIDPEGTASCIDTIPVIFGYGGITPGMNWVMDAGEAKFLTVGGADGQETWLYGVRDSAAYQPEVSGQHADFGKIEDGRFIAQPHEGGEGYYILHYSYDPETGEFVLIDGDGKSAAPETGTAGYGHEHMYTGTVTLEPTCTSSGTETFTCSCGDTYTETLDPSEHDWERREELVSHEFSGNKESTVVKWTSVCKVCGATRNF
ncbi:MAG: hypothetical protein K2O91_09990 [Lachnospiraceae bacterium]|nr:hypothetical protein [Lachnospiraceae bacterium]